MEATPQKEHQWLQKFLGNWSYESEAMIEPGKPPAKFVGTETVRSIGGFWVVCEGSGTMPGGETGTTIMTLGYDSVKKRYVGTFIGSMMAHLWIYDGLLDSERNILTLNAEGPGFSVEGSTAKYKDVIEFKSDDHRVLSSHELRADGTWNSFMTANYRRAR